MDKSPEAFRTISEVADFLDTPAHVLRFWESRFPQIRPVKRAGGRRYYRPGDVALLAGIKKLLHDDGITIRGVQKILREQGIRFVAGLASGDAQPELDDSDIEAVLSAEYGPRDRLDDPDQETPEALQTAQIISLETALNRPDPNRNVQTAQPELWPRAPLEDIPASDETEAWPSDPGDEAAETDAHDSDDMVTLPAPSDDDAQLVELAAAGSENAMETSAEVGGVSEDTDAARSVAEPDAEEPGLDEAAADVADASTAEVEDVLQQTDDSGVAAAEQEATDDEVVPTSTVAALLRQASPDRMAGIQPDLTRIRDHLIDLRGRVSEAARRKVK